MTDDNLKTLSDHDLEQLIIKAQAEKANRARKRKEDAIAKIKELAGAAGVSVSIKGARGRPAVTGTEKSSRPAQAK